MSDASLPGPLIRIRTGLSARIVDSLSAVIIIVDNEKRVVKFNPAAERMSGVLAEDAVGKPFGEVHASFGAVESEHALDRTLQMGFPSEVKDVEVEVRGFTHPRHFDFIIDPILNDDSAIAGASIMAVDVTELMRLRSRMARQNEDMVVLHRVSNVLRSTMDVQKALFIICTALTSVGSARNDHAMVFLDESNSGSLKGMMAVPKFAAREIWHLWQQLIDPKRSLEGVLEAEFPKALTDMRKLTRIVNRISIARDDPRYITAHAARSRQVLTHKDVGEEGRDLHPRLRRFFGMRSFAVLPLVVDNESFGVLLAHSSRKTRSFGTDSLKILEMFADQAALAINNSLMFRRIAERAQRDSLTGLHNHGYFQTRLADELGRARRYGDTVALLLLDLDYFKKLNDTHGHQAGDAVLVNLAGVLNATVRTTDT